MTATVLTVSKNNESFGQVLFSLGGIFCTRVDNNNLSYFKHSFKDHSFSVGEPIILVEEDLVSYLTKEEYAVMIAHEEGHIKLNHLDLDQETIMANSTQHEQEADHNAVLKYGKTLVLNTILRIMERYKTVVLPEAFGAEYVQSEIFIPVLKRIDEELNKRLAPLYN